MNNRTLNSCLVASLTLLITLGVSAPIFAEIEIANLDRKDTVDFESEILPILRKNCLACHNASDAESDLILETPQTILKGGASGDTIIPGKPAESSLLAVASHADEPIMPPEDNEVGAKNLTPKELALLKLWIEQGAKGEVTGSGQITWQALPPGINPIYTTAITAEAQYAFAGRANQIFVYHVPTKQEIGRLTDSALQDVLGTKANGIAHLDIIQSLTINPSGDLLASGGYRNIKLWQKESAVVKNLTFGDKLSGAIAVSSDGNITATADENGNVTTWETNSGKQLKTWKAHSAAVSGISFSKDGKKLATVSSDKTATIWQVDNGQSLHSVTAAAELTSVAWIADDSQIATSAIDGKIYTLASTKAAPTEKAEGEESAEPKPVQPIKVLAGHSGKINVLKASSINPTLLISGGDDGSLRTWQAVEGKQIRQFNHGGKIKDVAIDVTGKRLASASDSGSIRIWEFDNGKQLFEFKGNIQSRWLLDQQARVTALAKKQLDNQKKDLEEAKKRLEAEKENKKNTSETLTKSEEDLKKKEEALVKPKQEKETADTQLADAKTAFEKATAERDTATTDATTAEEAFKKAEAERNEANKQKSDGAKKLSEADKAKNSAPEDKKEETEKAYQAAKTAQDTLNANADAKEKAYQLSVKTRDEAKKLKSEKDKLYNDTNNKVKTAENTLKQKVTPFDKALNERDSAKRAVEAAKRSVQRAEKTEKDATDKIGVVEQLVKQAEEKHTLQTTASTKANEAYKATEKGWQSVVFSNDGKILVAGSQLGTVGSWAVETGKSIASHSMNEAGNVTVSTLPNGQAMACSSSGKAVVLKLIPGWKLQKTIGDFASAKDLEDRVTALDFSPDGKILASGGGSPSRSGELKIWNVETGLLIRELKDAHSDTVFDLEFSPEGTKLASCGADRFMKVFHADSGKLDRSYEGHTHHVLGVSWRADGRRLVTSGADKVVKIWDALTGDQSRTITGFGKEVTSIEHIRDARSSKYDYFVTTSGDKAASIRQSDNGRTVRSLGGASDFVYSVSTSADGESIVIGGADSVLRIYNGNDGKLLVSFEPPAIESTESQQAQK